MEKKADIQRECRKCVGAGSQGFKWPFSVLASQTECVQLLERQFPEEFVIKLWVLDIILESKSWMRLALAWFHVGAGGY